MILTRRHRIANGLRGTTADFFRDIYLQADQEQRVELVGNYLQLLWRAGIAAGLGRQDPAMQKLDGLMGQWWIWRQQYHQAVLRRWIPFTRAWGEELDQWSDKVAAAQTALDTATQNAVSTDLTKKGLDPTMIAPSAGADAAQALLDRTRELLRSPWFWPAVGTVGVLAVIGMGIKLYRDAQHLGGGFSRG